MQMTIGEALDKIDKMRRIVKEIENGNSVENHLYDIALCLDEYICVLSNTKVHI
jgi:hypothetical protein